MNYSFIIIGADSQQSGVILQCMENFRYFSCSGHFANEATTFEKLLKLKPHLVFVNVDSFSENTALSFETINELHQYMDRMPYFVAISTTPQFAFQAIQSGFSDYLLTPLDCHQLGKCLFKFEKRNPKTTDNMICIKSFSDYRFVDLQDVIYLKADNNSVDFKLQNGETITAFKTLKHFEQKLPFFFMRIHKSYIVNSHYVSRIYLSKSRCYLNYNEILPFSASYRAQIDDIIKKLEL